MTQLRHQVATHVTIFALMASGASAQTTIRVSVSTGGAGGDNDSYLPAISADGRFVAFSSLASNLVPGDTNGVRDVFVHDGQLGTTERVSVDSGGAQGNGDSNAPSISADGRYVAFESDATNLATGDTNGWREVFVHDRLNGTTERVSVATGGTQGNSESGYASISADGRYVAFWSEASNLVPGDTNGAVDTFVHDQQAGTTERVSVDSGGAQGNGYSNAPSVSGDGRYVAFASEATNLVPGDANGWRDVFVHDRLNGTTGRVSVDSGGAEGNYRSDHPSISADSRYVAFESGASNLVPGGTNGSFQTFVRDRQGGMTQLVSVTTGGVQADLGGSGPSISADGRYVGFHSRSTNLFPGDWGVTLEVYVHDRQSGVTSRVSVSPGGMGVDGESGEPSISADGRYVAFDSNSGELVPMDTNMSRDVFVRDQGPEFTITPFFFGDGTGIACPCGNSGLPGHGCENSASTGGALLAGTGEALLSADTLQLTASGERPTSFSLFWQGGSEVQPRVFGDGVGCLGVPFKRMFHHNAVGGVVSAPQGADLSVSTRSAALGDPISPGTIRVYHVFYRDPDPNFCSWPFGATFNATNGLRLLWGT